jgi:hypothetical protein
MGCRHSKFPPEGHDLIKTDTNVTIEEDIRTTVTYRNLQTPQKRAKYLYCVTRGSLGISDQRIMGYIGHNHCGRIERQVHVPFGTRQENLDGGGIYFSITEQGYLCVHADLSQVHHVTGQIKGTMDLVYQTSQASTIIMTRLPHTLTTVAN